jgi:hypothetical protein
MKPPKTSVEGENVNEEQKTGLAALRVPFAANHISKLPKPYKKDSPKGNCPECGGYHGLPAMHLDYVGHAALTDRLLDVDPAWSWEPVALGEDGLPKIDAQGGLWIRLTVLGVTRLGYGDADGKTGPAAMKERIGDALRNAAMRFGAALDLWHKGDLHGEDDAAKTQAEDPARTAWLEARKAEIMGAANVGALKIALATAIEFAVKQDDSAAVDLLNSWADEKRAQAKPRAVA